MSSVTNGHLVVGVGSADHTLGLFRHLHQRGREKNGSPSRLDSVAMSSVTSGQLVAGVGSADTHSSFRYFHQREEEKLGVLQGLIL